jgi:hypothetical protein
MSIQLSETPKVELVQQQQAEMRGMTEKYQKLMEHMYELDPIVLSKFIGKTTDELNSFFETAARQVPSLARIVSRHVDELEDLTQYSIKYFSLRRKNAGNGSILVWRSDWLYHIPHAPT